MTAQWLFVATYPEWLNWIAAGRIRCNDRITRVNGITDKEGFALLMDRSPDVSIEDDQAYVIAKLKQNFRSYLLDVDSANSPDLVWLELGSVESFLPLSERGYRLIEADAQRARVRLGAPIFQEVWQSWRDTQLNLRSNWRGQALISAFGLSDSDLIDFPEEIKHIYSGKATLPNAEKRLELCGTNAFPWAAAFAVFGTLVNEEEKKSKAQALNLREMIGDLSKDFSVKKPITLEKKYRYTATELTRYIKEIVNVDVSILQAVVIFHYLEIIRAGKEIVLESLIEDLVQLGLTEGIQVATTAAYEIGRGMDEIAVQSLVYSTAPDKYVSLNAVKLTCNVNITQLIDKERAKEPLIAFATISKSQVTEGERVELMPSIDTASDTRDTQETDLYTEDIKGIDKYLQADKSTEIIADVQPHEFSSGSSLFPELAGNTSAVKSSIKVKSPRRRSTRLKDR